MSWIYDNIVALLALIISGFATYFSWIANKKIVSIEEKRENERKEDLLKAKIEAEIALHDGKIFEAKYEKVLVINNEGDSEARNVEILIDKVPLSEHHAVVARSKDAITKIAPYGTIKIGLKDRRLEHSFVVSVIWEDDYKANNTYQTTLTKIT